MEFEEILFTEQQLSERAAELGRKISEDYSGESVLAVCTLKGAVIFFSDLIRKITLPCEIDFIAASSYGDEKNSSGNVKIVKDLETDIKDKNVILVEDIIDTGITLKSLSDMLRQREPKSLKICAMFNKPSRRAADIEPEYIGFDIPDRFVVGYGLDYAQKYRNVPFLAAIK